MDNCGLVTCKKCCMYCKEKCEKACISDECETEIVEMFKKVNSK